MRRLEVVPDVAEAAARIIVARRPRTLVLTGGNTPQPLYRRLATLPLPWSEMELFFGDERCVPPGHPDSNYGRAAEALLDHIEAHAVYRMHGEDCDGEGYERDLRARFGPGIPTFDLTLLGLGADGHVASLFPGDPAVEERDHLVLRVEHSDHPRLTLTLPVLSASRLVLFLVSGEAKREALAKLMAGAPIPAARVAAPEVVVLADAMAAS